MKTYLLTGASGYLGSKIKRHLEGRGVSVISIQGRAQFTSQLDGISPSIGIDGVIHAGFDVDYRPTSSAGESENIINTRAVVRFCADRHVKHLVFLSAAGALGVSKDSRARNEDDLGTTDDAYDAYRDTLYIQDKLRCEELIVAAKIPATILYLTTVYGPDMQCETKAALDNVRGPNPVMICPPGGTSFLDMRDFLDGIDRVLEKKPGGRLLLSSGNTTFAALYRTVAGVLGVSYRKRVVILPEVTEELIRRIAGFLPRKLITAAVIQTAFGFKYYSALHAQQALNWKPSHSLEDALRSVLR